MQQIAVESGSSSNLVALENGGILVRTSLNGPHKFPFWT